MALDERHNEKVASIDWEGLRSLSLRPGGFGSDRAQIWPEILGANIYTKHETAEPTNRDVHRDERQIRLDTDRSFVLYPVGAPMDDKETMQEKLNSLLVEVFRKHPKLNYFQGYHDIVSVLFLTLPEEMQLVCAEKISLHRVRDSMGSTLEPVLGLLRVTKNLLRLADLDYAQGLERTSQLPFYALSNLLTLFSHDMPTLPLIQHVFDYILCRPPIIVVYLATAIILSRKDAIRRLEEDDEDNDMGMSHSLLSSLPPITDESEQVEGIVKVDEDVTADRTLPSDNACKDEVKVKAEEAVEDVEAKPVAEASPIMVEKRDESEEVLRDMAGIEDTTEPMNLVKKEPNVEKTPPASSSVSLSSSHLPSRPYKHPEVKLSSLLAQAERLFFLYPPTHPELSLSSIMGPQSVVFTWSESFSTLPTDTEAEAMVSQPGLIVYPYIEEDEVIEDTDDANDEKWEKPPPGSSKRKRLRGKLKGKVKNKLKSFRRVRVDQKTGMVAGAIIVLGVAMAVYGVKMHDRHSGPGLGLGGGVLDVHGRDWRKVAGWLGGAVAGVTERVVNGLSPSMPRGG